MSARVNGKNRSEGASEKNSKWSVELLCGCSVRLTCWLLCFFGLRQTRLQVRLKRERLMSNYLLRCGLDWSGSCDRTSFFLDEEIIVCSPRSYSLDLHLEVFTCSPASSVLWIMWWKRKRIPPHQKWSRFIFSAWRSWSLFKNLQFPHEKYFDCVW